MRINSLGNIQSIMKSYEANKPKKSEKIGMKKDEVQISSKGREFQLAMKAIKESSEVRSNKIDTIKNEVETNTYKVDSKKLAETMIKYFR